MFERTAAYAENALENGLVGHWQLDEGQGEVAKDSSGHGNDGRVHGATWVKTPRGSALLFNGSDDYVDCGNGPSLNLTDKITVEAWIFVRALPTPAGQPGIVFKHFSAYALTYYSDGQCHFYVGLGRGGPEPEGAYVLPNAWHHVAGVFDGTTISLYVDGKLATSQASKISSVSQGVADNVLIGRNPTSKAPGYFNGAIADARIYSRVLSEREIREHYESSRPAVEASYLVLKGKFTLANVERALDKRGIYLLTGDSFVPQPGRTTMCRDVSLPNGEYSLWARMFDGRESRDFLSNVVVAGRQVSPQFIGQEEDEYKWFRLAKVRGGHVQIEAPAAKAREFMFLLSKSGEFMPRDRQDKIAEVKNERTIAESKPWTAVLNKVYDPEPESPLPVGWKASWIKHPQDSGTPTPTSFYMRRRFTVDGKMYGAWVQLTADDEFKLYINGKEVLDGAQRDVPRALDITSFLNTGQNVFAVQYANSGGPGGLLFEATIHAENGVWNILSDSSWRCSKKLEPGWAEINYHEGADWQEPTVIGQPPIAPWGRVAYKYALGISWSNADTVATVVKEKGCPVFKVNGKKVFPIIANLTGPVFSPPVLPELRSVRDFTPAGIHLYFLPAEYRWVWKDEMWLAPGKYDFWRLDSAADTLLGRDPEARFWVVVQESPLPYGWWSKAHRDQTVQFADKTGGFVPDSWGASYGGEAYRRQGKEKLLEVISHIERSPYSQRVLGYLLCGPDVEWFEKWTGHSDVNQLIDYSPVALQRFRQYLKAKYRGDVSRLREAWNDKTVDFDSATIPSPEKRRRGELGFLRDPKEAQDSIDYLESWADNCASDINYFAEIVKVATHNRRTVAVYYGYVYTAAGVQWLMAHLGVRKVHDAPYVDFFLFPQHYAVRGIGGPCEYQNLFSSDRLAGKIPIMDNDIRTHIGGMAELDIQSFNLEQTLAVMQRDFGYVLTRQDGIAWFPLTHPDAFHDPQIVDSFEVMRKVGQIACEEGDLRNTEIAVIVDAESLMYETLQRQGVFPLPSTPLVYTQMLNLGRLGAPVAQHLFSDLLSPDFPDYKLYIFLNCFRYTEEYKEAVARKIKKAGKVAIWMYAPGFYRDSTASDKNMEGLTGIVLRRISKAECPVVDVTNYANPLTANGIHSDTWGDAAQSISPMFYADDPGAKVLGQYRVSRKAGLAIKKINGWKTIFVGSLVLPSDVARNAARLAGVHIYDAADDVISANRKFLMIHTTFDGKRTISLPRTVDVVDVFRQDVTARGVTAFALHMPRNSTRVFYLGNAKEFLAKLRSHE